MGAFATRSPSILLAVALLATPVSSAPAPVESAVSASLTRAQALYAAGKYTQAGAIASDALASAGPISDTNVLAGSALRLVALVNFQEGDYARAEPQLKGSIAILGHADSSDRAGADAYRSLANLYFLWRRFGASRAPAAGALVARKAILGDAWAPQTDAASFVKLFAGGLEKDGADYRDLMSLAILQDGLEAYADAKRSLERALAAAQSAPSVSSADVRTIRYELALSSAKAGDYKATSTIMLQALKADEATDGPTSLVVARDVGSLLTTSLYLADLDGAKTYLARLGSIASAQPAGSKLVVDALNFAGELAFLGGNFDEAERLLRQSLDTKSPELSDEAEYRATALTALAGVYMREGRFPQADEASSAAMKIDAAISDSVAAASVGIARASMALLRKDVDSAIALATLASDILGNQLGKTRPEYAEAVHILGEAYGQKNQLAEAQAKLEEAFKIETTHYGAADWNEGEIGLAEDLAIVDARGGHYAAAESLLQHVLRLREAAKVPSTESLALVWKCFAFIYEREGKFPQAEASFKHALDYNFSQYAHSFSFMSERDRMYYLSLYSDLAALFGSFCQRHPNTGCAGLGYDVALWQKGMIANDIAAVQQRIVKSGSPSLQALFKDVQTQRTLLSSLKLAQAQGRTGLTDTIVSLEETVDRSERELVKGVPALPGRDVRAAWESVRAHLGDDEAAVEYVYFPYNSGASIQSYNGDYEYGALVLRKSSKAPAPVYLGRASVLEGKPWRGYQRSLNGQLSQAHFFYDAFWKPLVPLLRGAKRIYVAPSGVLGKVSFAAVMGEDDVPLVQRYDVRIVASTKDILEPRRSYSTKTAVLVGNPDFNATLSAPDVRPSAPAPAGPVSVALVSDVKLAPLPGTAKEVAGVGKLLEKSGWNVTAYTAGKASKSVVQAVNGPRILHIATHGYFISGSQVSDLMERVPLWYPEDAMLLSGLFFAGASKNAPGLSATQVADNGVLTAYEASGLNLFTTELVVLSACDTGLGQVQNGEGILGLRRAFHEAGAESVMMTMWPIPDAETQQLMTLFYQNWLHGMDKTTALRAAQLTLRRAIVKKYGGDVPLYWGGFVLSD